MEDLNRMHAEVPFGWFLMLQEMLAARRARKAAAGAWREPAGEARPGGLHHLAAPH